MTYGGEGTEIKLLGVYLDKSAAKAALESLLSEFPATTGEVSAVPVNKIDRYAIKEALHGELGQPELRQTGTPPWK